jgi:hypothetical protein
VNEASQFGTCCEDLRQAMHKKANSTFSVESGILFLVIGILPTAEGVGYMTKPVRFCPFCGTELQSPHALQAWASRV